MFNFYSQKKKEDVLQSQIKEEKNEQTLRIKRRSI